MMRGVRMPAMELASAAAVALIAAVCASAGCRSTEEPRALTLTFQLQAGGLPLRCGVEVASERGMVSLRDARLFVSEVYLIDTKGESTPAALVADGRWQTREVALLDFEDASGGCEGDTATNVSVRVTAPPGPYSGVRFVVGVPFALNHQNPALAAPPLTTGAMQWGWRAGYKFLKVEARVGQTEARVHVGSTECQGSIGAITGCARPNRGAIEVRNVDPASAPLVLDVLSLFPVADDLDCMGVHNDPGCSAAFRTLGISTE